MRLSLFRGKSIVTNQWVYGGYYKHLSRTPCPIGDRVTESDYEHYIFRSGFSDWNMLRPVERIDVIPETVGEYTGLKDKHGNKIFEGDIIGVWFEKEVNCIPFPMTETWCEYPEVYFDEKYHAWCAKFEDGESEYLYEYDEDCEVVGNIHETKLEVAK